MSTTKTKLGVSYDWVIGVAAHGKDMSDGECGAAKGCVNTANMEQDARHTMQARSKPKHARHNQ